MEQQRKRNHEPVIEELKAVFDYDLNTIKGCQRVLVKLLKKNHGDIISDTAYHILDEKCHEMLFKSECHNAKGIEHYKKRQEHIDTLTDSLNTVNMPLGQSSIINRIIKNRFYCVKSHKCEIDY